MRWMFFPSCLLCLLSSDVASLGQLPPEKALSTFTVASGLKLELFASEPMFTNPTCIDVDERGRVWVCESVNYRYKLMKKKAPHRPDGDRIVILHDTDGDGKADKSTTFYQHPDFLAPLGIAVSKNPQGLGYKVYVCHSPHLYLFEDKDGDGKADGPPTVLLTGFRGIDHDHGIHGIHFGPDGKLYFSVGDQGVKGLQSRAASAPGGKLGDFTGKVYETNQTDCKAGTMWRCNTDGSQLELLAHNFRNQYEPAVNSFGTMFTSDNDDDGNQQTRICHVMYGGDYGYWPRNKGDHHWHEDQPGVVHKTLRTGFGSPTGLCWYEGKLLEKDFNSLLSPLSPPGRGAGGEGNLHRGAAQRQNKPQGKDKKNPLTPTPSPRGGEGNRYEGFLLHTDAGPREVRLFGVRPKGAGYELDRVNLVTSSDNWFRPCDVCVAPDGSVFIADWYDPGVGGHGMGDTTRGRIYRLKAKEHNGYQIPPLQKLNPDDEQFNVRLAHTMSSPNLAAKTFALDVILDVTQGHVHHAEGILKEIQPHLKDALRHDYFQARWEQWHRTIKSRYDQNMLTQIDPLQSVLAVRMGHEFYTKIKKEQHGEYLSLYRSLKTDAARREALLTLQYFSTPDIKSIYYDLAKLYDGQDQTYLSALNIALGTDPQRREVILADFEKHFPTWNDTTARLVWELRPPRVIAKLGDKLAKEPMTPLQTELALGAIAASSGPEGGESLLKLLNDTRLSRVIRASALKTLILHMPGKWKSLKSSFLVQRAIETQLTDGEMIPAVIQLITICERKDFVGFLERAAYNNEGLPSEVQLAGIAGLATFRNVEAVRALTVLLMRPEQPAIRKAAMTALGKMGTEEALVPLQKYLGDSKVFMEDRLLALEALAGSRAGTVWLLEQQNKKELPMELVASTGRLLRNSPHQDLRNKAYIAFPLARKLDLAKLPSAAELARKQGNAEHGKTLVLTHKDLGCIRCHGIQGLGGQIGPDLSMIGVKGSRENLLDSILTPDKAIADQYIQQTIETKNGVVLTGLVVEDTPEFIVLRDANGKDTKLALREVEQRSKSTKSIMPADLASQLTEEELVDVLAYLATLKSPALSIDRWQVAGPFPNDANDAGLEKSHGPEKGYSATARYDGKKGSVQWKSVSVNAAGYLDLAALHADLAPNSVSYVYAEIEAAQAGWGDIKLGTDDGVNVYFNGRVVYKHRKHEAAEPGKDTIAVEFQKGRNTLLLQVSNGNNPHGVYCTVLVPGTEPPKLLKP